MDYNIFFYSNSVHREGLFVIRLYAKNEKKALKNAIEVRDHVNETGEWNMAWRDYVNRKLDLFDLGIELI